MRKVEIGDIAQLRCPLCGVGARVIETVVQESGRHVTLSCPKCELMALLICRGMGGIAPVVEVAKVVEPIKEKKVEKSKGHTPALKFKKKGE